MCSLRIRDNFCISLAGGGGGCQIVSKTFKVSAIPIPSINIVLSEMKNRGKNEKKVSVFRSINSV